MQLRQAEPLGVFDHHHGRVRHVDADFDDGRRHEHVNLARRKRAHHAVFRVLLHLPVQQRDAVFGKDVLRKRVGHLRGGLEIDFLRLLDQRIDDVGLPPLLELRRERAP